MIEVTTQTPPIRSGRLIRFSSSALSVALHEQRDEHHRCANGDDIGFEQVGGHAGAVADIVANVVGDNRRVAWIVFGNAGFDLADKVGADVSGLGEDAAAETREDRDQRSAEGQRDSASTTVRSVRGHHGPDRSDTRRTRRSRAAQGQPRACR
jgi:hypothetical protein